MRLISVNRSVIEAAEEEIRSMATDLKTCHTINGEFPADDKDAKEHYEYLIGLADRLQKSLSNR